MEKTEAVFTLSVALFGSAIAGVRILSLDAWLWAAARTHAFGLVAFVAMDVVLIAALWRGIRDVGIFSIILATIQLLAMGGDLAGLSTPSGVPANDFQSYLLSDRAFVVLFWLQPVISFLGGLVRMEEKSTIPNNLVDRHG